MGHDRCGCTWREAIGGAYLLGFAISFPYVAFTLCNMSRRLWLPDSQEGDTQNHLNSGWHNKMLWTWWLLFLMEFISHASGDWNSEIRLPAGSVSGKGLLLGSQIVAFSLLPQLAFLQYV